MSRLPCFVPLSLLVLGGLAHADSLTDHIGTRAIALGDAQRAEAVGIASTVLNPAGLVLNNQLSFEGSYGYRSRDQAKLGSVAACDSTTPVAGCFYYNYLSSQPGIDPDVRKRRLQEGGVTAARAFGKQLFLGVNTHYFDYNSNVAGEEDKRGIEMDFGVIFQPSSMLRVAGVGYNLTGTESAYYPRGIGTGIALRPGSGALGITFDALWNLDRAKGEATGRYGGGIEYLISPTPVAAYPLRGGALYDALAKSTYMSLGIGFATPKMSIDLGGRRQVSGGGNDLVIQAGLRLVGPTPGRRQ